MGRGTREREISPDGCERQPVPGRFRGCRNRRTANANRRNPIAGQRHVERNRTLSTCRSHGCGRSVFQCLSKQPCQAFRTPDKKAGRGDNSTRRARSQLRPSHRRCCVKSRATCRITRTPGELRREIRPPKRLGLTISRGYLYEARPPSPRPGVLYPCAQHLTGAPRRAIRALDRLGRQWT